MSSERARIQLAHGSGGGMSRDLIAEVFVKAFDNAPLNRQDDSAVLELYGRRFAFTTDSYVVDPIFFPGGDIGDLAVNGTINDLSTTGGTPIALSAGFIIEEGFLLDDLRRVVDSMKRAAAEAGVQIVTGDTKVVERGKGDKLFVNTSGLALIDHDHQISCANLKTGDSVIITGSLADHGVAILAAREDLPLQTPVPSDTAPLNGLVREILAAGGEAVHAMRDPTRGGVAAALNEMARSSRVGIAIEEALLPIKPPVSGACEILGLDPLYLANEGKMLVFVGRERAEQVLEAARGHRYGREAAIIGEVVEDPKNLVSIGTRLGARRILDMPVGLQLPRIC